MGIVKKIGIGIGAVFLILIILGVIGATFKSNSSGITTNQQLTVDEIKSSAFKNVTYDTLLRNNENYVGKIVYYQGEISQVSQVNGDNYVLRVAVTPKGFGLYTDNIWVNYNGPRVLENDLVNLWGTVKGLKTYTAVLGNEITIPEVDALILNVTIKAGQNS